MCNLQSLIKVHAFEAGAFVLSGCGYMDDDDFPEKWHYIRDGEHMNYDWARGGSSIVNPAGRYLAEPNFEKDAIIYAECYANQIKAVKAVFDSLGHYSRWDVAQLALRQNSWEPEIALNNGAELPKDELEKISEKYEIDIENLEALISDLNGIKS